MAEAKKPSLVKLIIGAIFAGEGVFIEAKKRLQKRFGPCDFASPLTPFDFTEYYKEEMGSHLFRRFLSFQRLINPQALAEIKVYTNRLERQFSPGRSRSIGPSPSLRINSERNRSINLDPGYICAAKLVLASCKDYSHRIYLDKGVYAEVTLQFQDGDFRALAWTYPDYKSKAYLQSLNTIREIYMRQLPRKASFSSKF